MSRRGKRRQHSRCALCGKFLPLERKDVVTGTTRWAICSACAATAAQVQATKAPPAARMPISLTPQKFVEALDRRIIGQDAAKRAVAVALWKQQLKASGCENVPRATLLLHGPTGCGKTAIVREAAKIVGLPFVNFDATTLSEAEYLGRDAQDTVHNLMDTAGHPGAYGIIFLDEIDKLSAKGSEQQTAYSRSTQHALLKLVEGTDVDTSCGPVHTEDLLFVFGGAFHGPDAIVRQRVGHRHRTIGFGAEESPREEASEPTTKDFLTYGMEPELMGRVTQRVGLDKLTEAQLRQVLLDAEGSALRRYQDFFQHCGLRLDI